MAINQKAFEEAVKAANELMERCGGLPAFDPFDEGHRLMSVEDREKLTRSYNITPTSPIPEKDLNEKNTIIHKKGHYWQIEKIEEMNEPKSIYCAEKDGAIEAYLCREYRVAEEPDIITIQIRVYPERGKAHWHTCDSNGNEAHQTTRAYYDTVDKAKTSMERFIEGVIYHYPKSRTNE